ncbi:MAG: DUF3087 domain-containing protein [Gammaproteobacteria bacterium]|nr:DUF3087 domain-containing protein [Gammaproteobacteria bacterium]MDX2487473.1 DUF3087 domain-containing protein [Gammaproteobacteria bacterium]
MQLREIDKTRYRKHLRLVFAGMAAVLIIIAISTSALLINLFSTPEASHFMHNLAGVVIAAFFVGFVLTKLRQHPFMFEVVYVWDLKQQLNRISRKQRKIEAAADEGNHDAMIIMNYLYRGSKQLYLLDDNTITMEDLAVKIEVLGSRMEAAGLSLSTDLYDPSMLDKF